MTYVTFEALTVLLSSVLKLCKLADVLTGCILGLYWCGSRTDSRALLGTINHNAKRGLGRCCPSAWSHTSGVASLNRD